MKYNFIVAAILMLCLSFLLTSCGSVQEVMSQPIERSRLNMQQPAPLKLKSVMYTVIGDGIDRRYQIDQENMSNLMADFELMQNRMYLQSVILEKYKVYYEPLESK